MMQIYSMYNKKVGFWNPPTFGNMDQDSTKVGLARYCLMNPVDAKKAHYDECDLYYLGKFDEVRCEFDLLQKPEFLEDLTPYFKEESNV